jgi:hypothetical protein
MAKRRSYKNHPYVVAIRTAIARRAGGVLGVEKAFVKHPTEDKFTRKAIESWMNGKTLVKPAAVKALADILGLKNASTPEDVEKHYTAYWALDDDQQTVSAIGSGFAREDDEQANYTTALQSLRDLHALSETATAEAALAGLFDTMGLDNFIVVTTQNMPPAGFPERGYGTFVQSCYSALDRGLLIAYIVPAQKNIDWLRSHCPFMADQPYPDLRAGFDEFRDGYTTHLRNLGYRDIAWDAAVERTQLFEWPHEFPLTPCYRTISLVGDRRAGNDVLERGPHSNNEVALVARPASQPELLRDFVAVVLKHKRPNLHNKSKHNKRGTDYFVVELQERMSGNTNRRPSLGNFSRIVPTEAPRGSSGS